MRLAPFIVANTEPILMAWEGFARTILPAASLDAAGLRDHAAELLGAIVRDIDAPPPGVAALAPEWTSAAADDDGHTAADDAAAAAGRPGRLDEASAEHAIGRLAAGFDIVHLVSEYRALRASVLSLWHASGPADDPAHVADLALFNASIDLSLATAVEAYTRQVNESRDMFLAILSHDLRNPLNSISMSAHMLRRQAELTPGADASAKGISASAGVMARMISDLLDYTRTRLGAGMPIDRAPTDLAAVAREVAVEFRSAHPDVDLRVSADEGSDAVSAGGSDGGSAGCFVGGYVGGYVGEWDAARLRQVVSNLVGNAVQHGDRAAPIDVVVGGTAAEASLAVRNRGDPIPPGELGRIFDPLVRGAGAKAPRQHRPGSIGLGLYIARELVLAHGGRIGVTSTADAGTTFTFHLPRHARAVPDVRPGAALDPAVP